MFSQKYDKLVLFTKIPGNASNFEKTEGEPNNIPSTSIYNADLVIGIKGHTSTIIKFRYGPIS